MHKQFTSILKLAIGLGALIATGAASAIPIQYDWTGTTSNDSWNAMGYVVIDDSQYGRVLDATTELTDWMFSWTDGNVTFVRSLANGYSFRDRDSVSTTAQGELLGIRLCTNQCDFLGPYPGIKVSFDLWSASIGPTGLVTGPVGVIIEDFPTGSWSAGAPQSVPEPTSAALLGAGVIAFGALRRKKRKLTV